MNGPDTSPPAETMPQARPLRPSPGEHPLGPLLHRAPATRPVRARGQALLVFVLSLAVLGVAVYLRPNPAGLGTHRQLGFPACNMVVMAGIPCPTCGMTTAFSHTVRGQLLSAFRVQPAGLMLALLTVAAVLLSLTVLITGKVWLVNWYRLSPRWLVAGAVAVLLLAWAYKLAVGFAMGTLPIH